MSESFKSYPLLLEPHFSARPWGGDGLARVLGKPLPATGGPWGESWELSDHPDGRSRIAQGAYGGWFFGELVRRHPQGMCGVTSAPERFPLLVKYIDAAEDLSLQVHPDDARAPEGDRGKTECWFIIDCAAGAQVIHGLAPGIDAAGLRAAAAAGKIEPCIRRVPIRRGDFISIPAGTVHAILGGTLLCEIQQSSNTTYRLWDWDRRPARPLHLEEACGAADFSADPPTVRSALECEQDRWELLVSNPHFEVRTICWQGGERAIVEYPNPHGLVLNVVEGAGRLKTPAHESMTLRLGQTWFLPAGLEFWQVEAGEGPLRLLASQSMELNCS